MSALREAMAKAIEEKNSTLRCSDCGHKQSLKIVGTTGKKTVKCLGNNQKCKCQTAPSLMETGS